MLKSKRFVNKIATLHKQIYRSSSKIEHKDRHKDDFDTVIIGGGVVGASIAYHLAAEGCKDVLLLEKTELTAGSTWHAAGLVAYYNVGINAKRVHYDSLSLYKRLAEETGQEVGLHCCGSLRLATTKLRVDEMKYQMSRQRWNRAEQSLLTPDEVHNLHPLLNMDGVSEAFGAQIEAGLYNPGDGHIDPYSLTQALATGARNKGANIRLNSEVTGITQTERGDWTILLAGGEEIAARRIVNASGFWAKELGLLNDIRLPLIAVQHQYLVTSKVEETAGLDRELPVIRDLEGSYYLRQERDGLLFGIYEDQTKMEMCEAWYDDKVTLARTLAREIFYRKRELLPHAGFGRELFDSDVDRLQDNIDVAMQRVPALRNCSIRSVVNGPITYSPDGLPLVGPYHGLKNYWCAVGLGYGIIHAGGIGKYLAYWMSHGEPPYDLIEFDANRFDHDWVDGTYTKTKVRETYGMMNHVSFPFEERVAGRPSRRVNDLYDLCRRNGAQFGFHSGWEQPHWFNKDGAVHESIPSANFRRPAWFDVVASECHLVSNRVGVIDLSSFGKLVITGKDSLRFIDRICANFVPKVGTTKLTHMLTPKGKVLSELTVSRIDAETFYCVTGSASEIHDLRWMCDVAADDHFDVEIANVTDTQCVLGVAGPFSRRLLSLIAVATDFSTTAFPFMATRSVEIAGQPVRAVRISYSGELGYELYMAKENAKKVYEEIKRTGQHMGIGDFGSFAMNSMRLEKAFRGWGSEMNLDTNPLEAGLGTFIKTAKASDFIGRLAIEELMTQESTRRLAQFYVEIDNDRPVDPIGNESVWFNNEVVGNTTSGGFGHICGKSLCFAYIPSSLSAPGTIVQIELLGELYDAICMAVPPLEIESIREKRKIQSCDKFGKKSELEIKL